MSAITEQKCPCCGGAVEFDISSQNLKCPYCGTEFDIAALQQAEQNSVAVNAEDSISWSTQNTGWNAGETDGMNVYACKSCGGLCDLSKVDRLFKMLVSCVNVEYLLTALDVGIVYRYLTVKASGTEKGGVKNIGAVCCRDNYYALV